MQKNYPRFLLGASLVLLCALPSARASWTEIALPALTENFASYRSAHLSDGRFVYGTANALSRQDIFGGSTRANYTGALSWDPSFVITFSDSLGAIGAGGFARPSPIYTFDPSDLGTAFAPIPGVTMQSYSAHFLDANGLLVGGNNGTGGLHSVSYVSLDGTTNKVIIDGISDFSGDFARDGSGNLYVSDNDDLGLYRFTATQIADALTAVTPLSITDGVFVTTLNKNGSLAVDTQGRIFSAGWQSVGFDLFDPSTGNTTSLVPGFANTNYLVTVFSDETSEYVGYLNADGFSTGDALNFGYDLATNLVPEPSAALLMAVGMVAVAARRYRRG